VIITYDSSTAVAVSKKDNSEYWVKMYPLNGEAFPFFEEKIGGNDDDYIKLKEVE
jgi:hypothetical protein